MVTLAPWLPSPLVNRALKEEIMLAAGLLQNCIGYSAGAEVAIHAMAQILDDDRTDEILLVDASNIQITCPEISMYIINTYRCPSRLFTCGGVEILSPGGGGTPTYVLLIGMCHCEGYGFQAVYSRIGYINQSVWV